jgi:hypothetical protein
MDSRFNFFKQRLKKNNFYWKRIQEKRIALPRFRRILHMRRGVGLKVETKSDSDSYYLEQLYRRNIEFIQKDKEDNPRFFDIFTIIGTHIAKLQYIGPFSLRRIDQEHMRRMRRKKFYMRKVHIIKKVDFRQYYFQITKVKFFRRKRSLKFKKHYSYPLYHTPYFMYGLMNFSSFIENKLL